jgi:hypothetical protein
MTIMPFPLTLIFSTWLQIFIVFFFIIVFFLLDPCLSYASITKRVASCIFKNFEFFLFLLKVKIFYILNCFNMLILKIIFKK